MFTHEQIERLRGIQQPEADVLSLYLPVPPDPSQLGGLTAAAGRLLAGRPAGGGRGWVAGADRDAVLGVLAEPRREWLGRTLGVFACARRGLLEVLSWPGYTPARWLLATRPQVRPLLAARQRCPEYRVALVDRSFFWLVSVSGGAAATLVRRYDDERPAAAGGAGTANVRVSQRHYRKVAAALRRDADPGYGPALVIGGRYQGVASLLAELPPQVQDTCAGTFTVDPFGLGLADVQELAQPVIDAWVRRCEAELGRELLAAAPPPLTVVGVPAVAAAIGQGAVSHLIATESDVVPGFACGDCGALATRRDCDCGGAGRPVPDLLDEMIHRTLDSGGTVTVTRERSFAVAARLQIPRQVAREQADAETAPGEVVTAGELP